MPVKKKRKYAKKITLAPMKFQEALGRLLSVKFKKTKSWKEILKAK